MSEKQDNQTGAANVSNKEAEAKEQKEEHNAVATLVAGVLSEQVKHIKAVQIQTAYTIPSSTSNTSINAAANEANSEPKPKQEQGESGAAGPQQTSNTYMQQKTTESYPKPVSYVTANSTESVKQGSMEQPAEGSTTNTTGENIGNETFYTVMSRKAKPQGGIGIASWKFNPESNSSKQLMYSNYSSYLGLQQGQPVTMLAQSAQQQQPIAYQQQQSSSNQQQQQNQPSNYQQPVIQPQPQQQQEKPITYQQQQHQVSTATEAKPVQTIAPDYVSRPATSYQSQQKPQAAESYANAKTAPSPYTIYSNTLNKVEGNKEENRSSYALPNPSYNTETNASPRPAWPLATPVTKLIANQGAQNESKSPVTEYYRPEQEMRNGYEPTNYTITTKSPLPGETSYKINLKPHVYTPKVKLYQWPPVATPMQNSNPPAQNNLPAQFTPVVLSEKEITSSIICK